MSYIRVSVSTDVTCTCMYIRTVYNLCNTYKIVRGTSCVHSLKYFFGHQQHYLNPEILNDTLVKLCVHTLNICMYVILDVHVF